MHFRFIFFIFVMFDRIGAFVVQPPSLFTQRTIYRKIQSSSLISSSSHKSIITHSSNHVQSKSDQSATIRSLSMVFDEGSDICPRSSITSSNKSNSPIRSSASVLFSSISRIHEGNSSMKGSISPNNNESTNDTSMIVRIYRATIVRFFQFLVSM